MTVEPLATPPPGLIKGPAPAARRPVSALDLALEGRHGVAAVREFLQLAGRAAVATGLRACLAEGRAAGEPRLLRAKLKPGRKLTASYAVLVPHACGPFERAVAVTWVAAGALLPAPDPDLEELAARAGVLEPFRCAWYASPDARMSVQVSPVDRAVPQLVRWHDPAYVAAALASAGFDAAPGALAVRTVRFRPGQRHVVRLCAGGSGPDVYAKLYRDDTGGSAVAASRRAGALFAAHGVAGASAGPGVYVERDRTALWPEVPGRLLSEVVCAGGPGAARAVMQAGAALRALHAGEVSALDRPGKDATAQLTETLRAAQVVEALLPLVGRTLRMLVVLAAGRLSALPEGPPVLVHGDVKGDNIIVGPAEDPAAERLHVLDFDRCGAGDPAADVGKLRADLRWCGDGDGPVAAGLHAALGAGYGPMTPAQEARTSVYDGLFQLRLAARRARVQDEDWEHRVTAAVESAAATLAGRAVGGMR